jgi:hypothetical protein
MSLLFPTTSFFRYLHNETYRSGTLRSVKPTPTKSWPLTKDEIAQLQHSIVQRCPLKVADSDADGFSHNIRTSDHICETYLKGLSDQDVDKPQVDLIVVPKVK